jgi:hypothetical protein
MIALSGGADKSLRAQVAETVALVADCDFPGQWPDLIDVSPLLATCSPDRPPSIFSP